MEPIQSTYAMAVRLAIGEGETQTDVPFLSVMRSDGGEVTMPDGSMPYVMVVASGSLRLHTIDGIRDLVPGDALMSAIVTPRCGIASCPDGRPFTAVVVKFSTKDVISVMIELDGDAASAISSGRGTARPVRDELLEAVNRLLATTEEGDPTGFMSRHIRREVVFLLIAGDTGEEFVRTVLDLNEAGEMYAVNSWIKENFREDFTVGELANRLDMSQSAFHRRFRTAVGMGPIRCQKVLRLTEARRLILEESVGTADAAAQVGYDSVSQFIRDYRSEFGAPPQRDVQRLRDGLRAMMSGSDEGDPRRSD